MDVMIWSCRVGQSVMFNLSCVFQSGSGTMATLQISIISFSVNPRPDRSNSSRTSSVHRESISSDQPLSFKYRRPLEIAAGFEEGIFKAYYLMAKIRKFLENHLEFAFSLSAQNKEKGATTLPSLPFVFSSFRIANADIQGFRIANPKELEM